MIENIEIIIVHSNQNVLYTLHLKQVSVKKKQQTVLVHE